MSLQDKWKVFEEEVVPEIDWGSLATSTSQIIMTPPMGDMTATGYPIYGPAGVVTPMDRYVVGPGKLGPLVKKPEEWLDQAMPDSMRRRLECLKCGAVVMVQERAIEQKGVDFLAHIKRDHRCEETPRQGYKCDGCGKAAFYLKHKAIIGPGCKIKKEDLWDAEAKVVPVDCQFCGENIIIPKEKQIKIFDVKSGEEATQ